MIGIGGLIGSLAGLTILLGIDYRTLIIVGLITAGCIGSSRLILGAHAPYQVYWGFLIGFLSEFCLLVYI
jgi:membrane-associated phospholipid phosphatase